MNDTQVETAPATREGFLAEYERQLVAKYEWAQDGARLRIAMGKVRATLTTDRAIWDWTGPTTAATCAAIGMTGRITLKRLRALPAADADGGTDAAR